MMVACMSSIIVAVMHHTMRGIIPRSTPSFSALFPAFYG